MGKTVGRKDGGRGKGRAREKKRAGGWDDSGMRENGRGRESERVGGIEGEGWWKRE